MASEKEHRHFLTSDFGFIRKCVGCGKQFRQPVYVAIDGGLSIDIRDTPIEVPHDSEKEGA